ncbi:PREDICTED: F-box protein SKIP23-like [Fragaria vesca subsp. vesca]|uniref:F-box protein SKIP23-like n=1 Tax=Fragaria vesca subsp. vesca TaxID=101020 RepID=UPI0002C36142|nr:PREDICTED: F-box protein SKIP23-like [Fragaria vesca subsp. vesca]
MDITVDWSNLPVVLWPLIGEKLKLRIEFLRFRSVCNPWRSYLPPFHPSTTPPPQFPLPSSSDGPTSFLSQNTVYLLRPPATSSPPSSGGWLVKVEECDRMLLRNPITSRRIRSGCFNLLEFDMVELGKSYFLRYIRGSGSACGLKKVVVMPSEIGECAILVISDKGNLGFARSGDQKLRWFSHEGSVIDDVGFYKGQSYVVDSLGCVFRITMSSHEMVKISSKVVGLGGRKHLVESWGELYVVDRYFDEEQSKQEGNGLELDLRIFGRRRGRYRRFRSGELKVVDFKVYKLEWGDGELSRWVEVNSLDDQVFFLANDCSFAVSAQELAGYKGNCIYFTDENDVNLALREVTRPESFVFDLENRSIQKLESSQIFWPPPIEFGCTSSSLD